MEQTKEWKVTQGNSTNTYCGPAALSIITGMSVEECITAIRVEIGDTPIAGIFYPTLLKVLKNLGYIYEERVSWRKTPAHIPCLIVFRGHFGVYVGGKYYDNTFRTDGYFSGLPIKTRVDKCFRIHKLGEL